MSLSNNSNIDPYGDVIDSNNNPNNDSNNQNNVIIIKGFNIIFVFYLLFSATPGFLMIFLIGDYPPNKNLYIAISGIIILISIVLLVMFVIFIDKNKINMTWDGLTIISSILYLEIIGILLIIAYYIPDPNWVDDIFFGCADFMMTFLFLQVIRYFIFIKEPKLKDWDNPELGWESLVKFLSSTIFYGLFLLFIFGGLIWFKNFYDFAYASWIVLALSSFILIFLIVYHLFKFPNK